MNKASFCYYANMSKKLADGVKPIYVDQPKPFSYFGPKRKPKSSNTKKNPH